MTTKTKTRRTPAAAAPVLTSEEKIAAARAAAAAAALEQARIDAEATGRPIAEVLADLGLAADGTRLPVRYGYTGPMLALRDAEKNYEIAQNGNPCNGDGLAKICGKFPRDEVVKTLIKVLKLESNPYYHLNPGQQSMNLRNKTRGALAKGEIRMGDVIAAFGLGD